MSIWRISQPVGCKHLYMTREKLTMPNTLLASWNGPHSPLRKRICGTNLASLHKYLRNPCIQAHQDEQSVAIPPGAVFEGQDRGNGLSDQRNPCIRLNYSTGWEKAVLHYSMNGNEWRDLPFSKVPSGDRWHRADIGTNGSSAGFRQLEFVVTNGQGEWDKPPSGENYVIDSHGNFAVKSGVIREVKGKPVMVVSDLDGTMIGDDHATIAFKEFWQTDALLRGSVLVYNTGRSLEGFQSLTSDKSHCLNAPDVLICSVGTKIYMNRGAGNWVENEEWLEKLDLGWNLDTVRETAYSALNAVGKDVMHFRPPDEQNDHKVTCGVEVSVVTKVLDGLTTTLESEGVQANIISSGVGQWRYVDIVPKRAGKLEALNFVRESYGFVPGDTVACGDSGNDILMLSGENPAIVVGNAQPDLVQWVNKCLEDGDTVSRLFFSTEKEAYGILDGLKHFGFRS